MTVVTGVLGNPRTQKNEEKELSVDLLSSLARREECFTRSDSCKSKTRWKSEGMANAVV